MRCAVYALSPLEIKPALTQRKSSYSEALIKSHPLCSQAGFVNWKQSMYNIHLWETNTTGQLPVDPLEMVQNRFKRAVDGTEMLQSIHLSYSVIPPFLFIYFSLQLRNPLMILTFFPSNKLLKKINIYPFQNTFLQVFQMSALKIKKYSSPVIFLTNQIQFVASSNARFLQTHKHFELYAKGNSSKIV